MEKIVVGMSGGVDSSISLILLKKQGFNPVGVSLKLPVWKSKDNQLRENACCTKESLNTARNVCKKFGVPHFVYNVQDCFKKEVIDYFVSELKKGRTPNPCMICNRYHKFAKLLEWADKHEIKYVATGHYAKKVFNKKTGEHSLMIPKDNFKDQTYGLALLTQEQLSRIIFPLADLSKKEVFEIAEKHGFEIFLKKKESQDFCFISNKSLPKFMEKEIGKKPGKIVDKNEKVLGEHKGLHFFTIGQKKGLRLQKEYHVIRKNVERNELVVTDKLNDTFRKKVFMKKIDFVSGHAPTQTVKVKAKIRHRHEPGEAELTPLKKGYELVFKEPQHAVTPGQFCVLYKEEVCLGGGKIE
ncbi:MAG: tRNA 2-thiouridine(34) synthase MnmA [Nanoarchaeota archaeon]|nr:tRNA 2-thiouridine(34) synthase MnmA [Nanoarchaeota archaeon]